MIVMASDMLVRDVVAAVRRIVPAGPAALHEPEFAGREWEYVKSCIDEGWVSTAGAFVDRFERELAAVTGRRKVISCVNGTTALHAALLVAGIRAGDEILIPALTFVATANAIHHCGAVPHLVDCEAQTLGMDPVALRRHLAQIGQMQGGRLVNRITGRPMVALVPVHIFGHPARMTELSAVAEEFGLAVIEDATEALGSRYDGRPVGTHGILSVLSFNGNKIITTGGGGAVLTDDEALAVRARHLTTTARVPDRWNFNHDEVGYNYRLPNLNAALGCAQLERLEDFVARKRRLANAYAEVMAEIGNVEFVREPPGSQSNYWLQGILLDPSHAELRDPLLEALNAEGLQSRPVWIPMHRLPFHSDCPRADLAVTDSICARLVNLPSSPRLADRLPQ